MPRHAPAAVRLGGWTAAVSFVCDLQSILVTYILTFFWSRALFCVRGLGVDLHKARRFPPRIEHSAR
jgi:hypothetical protein